MDPLPTRMRERIIELYDEGGKTKQFAEAMGTCRSAARRIRQNLRERGTLKPNKGKTDYAGGLTPDVERRLRELLAA